jgi:hypothetical protein
LAVPVQNIAILDAIKITQDPVKTRDAAT